MVIDNKDEVNTTVENNMGNIVENMDVTSISNSNMRATIDVGYNCIGLSETVFS